MSIVFGIDLGTTNSSIAYVDESGTPRLIEIDGSPLLPSVVGLDPAGNVLVGRAAHNQAQIYPERTIASVKRRMGSDDEICLGEQRYTPVEVSALILRRLREAATADLGVPVERAVVTVPAYFSDAQRTATREAGEVAGLKVERILNEPTAAALTYVDERDEPRTLLVYDLGGGTFDVSIVRTRGVVTEVLSSHGDTALGGDDFDQLLLGVLDERTGHPLDARGRARLRRTAQTTKIALSDDTHVWVREEHLAERDGEPLHLEVEVDRHEYERLIEPLLERTRDSIQVALREADVLARDLDEVLLVGGSTRTPRVAEMLHELTGIAPRCDVNPEHAVALGAAMHAARVAGRDARRILVDVTPFSFGTDYYGVRDGRPSPDCYRVIIRRNTPLPVRRSETFYTMWDGQEALDVRVCQGEQPDARDNLLLGSFEVDGLDPLAPEGSAVIFDLQLDLDGILEVAVTERRTGLAKRVTIGDAFRTLSDEDLSAARARVDEVFGEAPSVTPLRPPPGLDASALAAWRSAQALLDRARPLLPRLDGADHDEVRALVDGLHDLLHGAGAGEHARISADTEALSDVLFYLE